MPADAGCARWVRRGRRVGDVRGRQVRSLARRLTFLYFPRRGSFLNSAQARCFPSGVSSMPSKSRNATPLRQKMRQGSLSEGNRTGVLVIVFEVPGLSKRPGGCRGIRRNDRKRIDSFHKGEQVDIAERDIVDVEGHEGQRSAVAEGSHRAFKGMPCRLACFAGADCAGERRVRSRHVVGVQVPNKAAVCLVNVTFRGFFHINPPLGGLKGYT